MDEAFRYTSYGQPREYWRSREHLYQDEPSISCPSISRWALLRSKRVLSTAICRTILVVLTVMILTLIMLNPSSQVADIKVQGKVENLLLHSNPDQATETSTQINRTRSQEGDRPFVKAANWTITNVSRQLMNESSNLARSQKGGELPVEAVNGTRTDVIQPTPELLRLASIFAKKYAHPYPKHDSEFLSYLRTTGKQKWAFHSQNAKEFRVDLRAALGEDGKFENFVTTQQNTRIGHKMKFYIHGSMLISKQFHKLLPRGPIHTGKHYGSCSVVGSSGILNGSQCGPLIDKADFVLRFNMAFVKGYEADVGRKTNFTTLNPSLVYKKYNQLRTKRNITNFVEVLKQFKGSQLWLPAFSVSTTHRLLLKVATVARESKLATPIFGHPDHFTAVANLWRRTLNVTSRTTSGLHVVTSIFDLCDRIEVFGFYPFAKSLMGNHSLPYHYYDNTEVPSPAHSFSEEFKALLHLHELGIINFHLGSCL